MTAPLDIVVLGLSITSAWGNGHATTWRGLLREMARRGHRVTFLERDASWYAAHRDRPRPDGCDARLYGSAEELYDRFGDAVANADAVILGSYVTDGATIADWLFQKARGVVAFYDIDTPVTLAGLAQGGTDYLRRRQIARFDLYLSFTGGPTLWRLEREFGAPLARALYCSVDPDLHHPVEVATRWDLGYLGTYSDDRQAPLRRLLIEPAIQLADARFIVAGAQYPPEIDWPGNVERRDHVAPDRHSAFYGAQRFTLNLTRGDMVRAGWSPSVRLFEAAACGVPIISDPWPGLDGFFKPDREILIADGKTDVMRALTRSDFDAIREIGRRARERVLAAHTAAHRAAELETYLCVAAERRRHRAHKGVSAALVHPGR